MTGTGQLAGFRRGLALENCSPFVHNPDDSPGEVRMNVDQEREIIRLWHRLRLLEREGRPTAVVLRQIRKALAEQESQAA